LRLDDDRRQGRTVGERVLEEVPDQLRDTVGVERSAQNARYLDEHVAAGMAEGDLVHDLPDERREIDLAAIDSDAATEPRLREIEQVADHAPHPVSGARDPRRRGGDGGGEVLVPEYDPGAGDDGGERRAQVVPEQADELLAEARAAG